MLRVAAKRQRSAHLAAEVKSCRRKLAVLVCKVHHVLPCKIGIRSIDSTRGSFHGKWHRVNQRTPASLSTLVCHTRRSLHELEVGEVGCTRATRRRLPVACTHTRHGNSSAGCQRAMQSGRAGRSCANLGRARPFAARAQRAPSGIPCSTDRTMAKLTAQNECI